MRPRPPRSIPNKSDTRRFASPQKHREIPRLHGGTSRGTGREESKGRHSARNDTASHILERMIMCCYSGQTIEPRDLNSSLFPVRCWFLARHVATENSRRTGTACHSDWMADCVETDLVSVLPALASAVRHSDRSVSAGRARAERRNPSFFLCDSPSPLAADSSIGGGEFGVSALDSLRFASFARLRH